jgi:medium-chain acyl-CoA synthetase
MNKYLNKILINCAGWAKAAWSFFGAWNCGASLFIHDDRLPFNPRRLLDILHKFPITTLCAPPTAYRQLVLQECRAYLKSNSPMGLSHCTGAGEPLNDSVIETWHEMTGLRIYDGYGQTESILLCGNFGHLEIRPGSMGKPSPGVPLKIISPEGKECAPGVEGDIAVLLENKNGRGDFFGLFDGYLKSDGSLNRSISKLGSNYWYLTGDRATSDVDGYFWFVGRADDVINSAGYRIGISPLVAYVSPTSPLKKPPCCFFIRISWPFIPGPFEVESTLKLHPGVIESAVVASPDVSRGEVVKGFVVLTLEYASKAKSDLNSVTKELQVFCKEHAAPYKYPRKLQFVDGNFLPKTISGKIKRNELKAIEWSKGKRTKL